MNIDTKAIDKILNNFLAENDFECEVALDTDFAYYWKKSLITYALVTIERMDKLFMDFAFENGLKVNCGNFILSFFHELGHHETMWDLTNRQAMLCHLKKKKLTDSDTDSKKYFKVYDEKMATLWAIDYINNNQEKVKRLAEDLQIEISKLYAAVGVA